MFYEKYMVPTRGFQNVTANGESKGFRILVRICYYRGIPLALIGGFDVTVDGEHFKPEQLRFSVRDRTYTMDELGKEEKVRWEFEQAAVLTVIKPGGLKSGMHDVEVVQTIKPSYFPQGFVSRVRRTITLVA